MDGNQKPKTLRSSESQMDLEGADQRLTEQFNIIRDFFLTDCASEIINSLNTLTETFLFTESMNVTSEMRIHIANQLRVVTLISRLEAAFKIN